MPQCYCSPSVQEHDGEIVLTVDGKDSKDQVEAGKYLLVFFHDKGLGRFRRLEQEQLWHCRGNCDPAEYSIRSTML